MVGNDNHDWTRDEPQSVETEEGIVEGAFLGVVFQSEERRVDKHAPTNSSQTNQEIAGNGIVLVQNLKRK